MGGGYSPELIAHPAEPGLLYLRTDIGSVYRWNPNTRQWMPLTDYHAPSDYNLNAPESIALDPTDPDRLYIAAGKYTAAQRRHSAQPVHAFGGGDFYSTATGKGTAFTKVNTTTLPAGNGAIVASFANAGDLWLSTGNNGLHHSPDGGSPGPSFRA